MSNLSETRWFDARASRLVLGVVLIFSCAALLSACSMNGSNTTLTTVFSTPTPSGPTTTVKGSPPTITFNPALNARGDVAALSCSYVAGRWTYRGTVRNSRHNTRRYQIVVDFVRRPGDTVLVTGIVETPLIHFRATSHWVTKGPTKRHHVTCVIRQVQAKR